MNQILSSPQITPSPLTNEPSFTMATGSRSYARIEVDGDEEEEQGPRVFYRGERRWDATHQKRMRRGWDTQTVHAVGINSAMVRFLRELVDDKGRKGEGSAR